MIPLGDRSLYLCTPIREDLDSFVRSCLEGGVDILQLRDKYASPDQIKAASVRCRDICHEFNVPFIVNDDPELAVDIAADGIHVGQDDASIARCRELLGDESIVGLSTHAEEELLEGAKQPVTYLSAGPIEPTPTKPGRPGTGVGYIEFAIRHSSVPVFVTGGITPARITDLGAYGVRHFVIVRALTESVNPLETAKELRRALEDLPT